ncbi:MAG TPA: DMT family transporter [Bacillota bacterium]|nr:DMT family transporter [Bacillota bacterium]
MKIRDFFTHPLGIVLAASAATLFWGSAFPFIKLSYQELEIGQEDLFKQILFAGYRFVLASLLIFLFILILGRKVRYVPKTLPGLTRIAIFQTFLQYIFFYIGVALSTGIQGSIISGTTSFFQILIAHFMYRNDSLSTRKVIGLLIGFLGVIVANLSKGGTYQFAFGIGELLLLIAMFCGGLGNVLSKKEATQMDILYMTSSQMLLGGIGLLLIGVWKEGWFPLSFTVHSFGMLIYLSFASAGGFVLWNTIMKYNKVGRVSMYLFLIPVFGVVLSALLLQEELHAIVFVALVLVVAGIIIVNREKKEVEESSIELEKKVAP